MQSIMFGVPTYGGQKPSFWTRFTDLVLSTKHFGLEYKGYLIEDTSVVDRNRNKIGDKFLLEKADWIMWLDHDTVPPAGAIGALMDVGHPIVSGLYQIKKSPYRSCAFYRREDGLYQNVDNFHRGAIFPVDVTGIGCLLMHRQVLADYKENYTVLQRSSGGIFGVLNSKIKGKIPDRVNRSDGEVRGGVFQQRVYHPAREDEPFPYFITEYGRTEDVYFFEKIVPLGYKPMLNTGVVCDHIGEKEYKYQDYYKQLAYDVLGERTPPELLHENS